MRFNVSELLKSPPGTDRHYTFRDEERGFDEQAAEIRGAVRLMRTDRAILVMAEVETGVGCSCSRCLALLLEPVHFQIAEEFFPTIDLVSGVQLPPPTDGSFVIDAQHILDLSEAVRQYALLAVPMKPLCAPDCRGLCPSCGKDLNQGRCGCAAVPIDGRWAKLQELSAQLGNG